MVVPEKLKNNRLRQYFGGDVMNFQNYGLFCEAAEGSEAAERLNVTQQILRKYTTPEKVLAPCR